MRKILVFVSILIIIMTAATSLFLPDYISHTISNHLQKDAHAQNVQGEVQTHPTFLMADGKIDHLYYKADSAMLGQAEVQNLLLTGDNIEINMTDLLHQHFTIDKAQNIKLSCTIDEESLKNLLLKKISKLQNASVDITPELITVQANIPILNNTITANMSGTLYIADGSIFFKIGNFDVENDILGKININTKKDIMLLDKKHLPFDAQVDSIVQDDTQVSIVASTHKE